MAQLLALYTDPESHNAQRYRQTDDNKQTNSVMACTHWRRSRQKVVDNFLSTLTICRIRPFVAVDFLFNV